MFENNLYLISIRQAFLNLLPYFIMIGVTILIHQILLFISYTSNSLYEIILSIVNLYSYTTPLIISISISYFLAKNFDLNRILMPILTFLLFVSFYWGYKSDNEININLNFNFLMIIIPLFAIYIYKNLFIFIKKYIPFELINEELSEVMKSIVPFILTFLLSAFFVKYFILITSDILNFPILNKEFNLPIELTSIFSVFLSTLIWWISGIHGTNLIASLFGEDYLKQTLVGNLDANVFINNFTIYGGDGATLSLLLAVIFFIKNPFMRKIAFLSLPFSLFNINEIILFALPIILNIRLLFPFLFVPISNFLIGYIFFYFYPVLNNDLTISWIIPIFISGYAIDNSFIYVFLQFIQLTIGIFIYLPFLKKYENSVNESEVFENFKNSLGIKEFVEKSLHLNFIKSQQEIINEEKNISNLTNELSKGEMLLYYQPKIDILNTRCYGFEALIRFKNQNGEIKGPYFIEKIEQFGFEKIIDFWVINQVKNDLEEWKKLDFSPKISINISPESICDKQVINKIINDLKGFNIEIEILERTFAKKMDLFINNINKLKENDFSISVDDFGSGFSSLQYLNILPANIIKFDRALILNTKTTSGANLYKSISSMCKLQNFEIIAEGVETEEEMEIVKSSDINIVQGYYFSKAISYDEVFYFYNNFPDKG